MLQDFTLFSIEVLIFFITVVSSFLLTRIVLAFALRLSWVAASNERSSHVGNLAYGGGISVLTIALGAWLILIWPLAQIELLVLAGAIILAGISWVDDLKNLSSRLRISIHFIIVFVCLIFLPPEKTILPFDWPLVVDRLFAGFFWLWFINLFNFMDGIDGLAGVEIFFIGLGVILVGYVSTIGSEWQTLALVITGSVAGFLPWNWHRARIMLGDIGAVPLGFLLGFLLIQLALKGHWVAALVLPLYFVADATITILRRLIKGEKIWEAHRTHFYQRASRPTQGHDRVVVRVIIANIFLVVSALYSLSYPLEAGVFALAVVSCLLFALLKMAKD